jgi:hypothetical protein
MMLYAPHPETAGPRSTYYHKVDIQLGVKSKVTVVVTLALSSEAFTIHSTPLRQV